jgi:hypothetical protein
MTGSEGATDGGNLPCVSVAQGATGFSELPNDSNGDPEPAGSASPFSAFNIFNALTPCFGRTL